MEFRTLKANEIDCRVAQIDKTWLTLLLYKDARADMDVLDECAGNMNWKREHIRDNANCIVSIWNSDIKEWVSKEDTGTESFSEAEKGLASDSFKRACVNWGIGRELYTAPSIFILSKKDIKYKIYKDGKQVEVDEFFEKGNGKYDTKTKFWVEYIDYTKDREIQNLIIRDQKNNIRFSQLTEDKEKELGKLDVAIKKAFNEDEELEQRIYNKYKIKDYAELLIKQKKEIVELINNG